MKINILKSSKINFFSRKFCKKIAPKRKLFEKSQNHSIKIKKNLQNNPKKPKNRKDR